MTRHLQAVPDLVEDGYSWGGVSPEQLRASMDAHLPLAPGRSDGGLYRELTADELDELEAMAGRNSFVPTEVTLAIVADERRRRAHRINKAHALAGWPLGRPQ